MGAPVKLSVEGPDGLRWKITRPLLPAGMRMMSVDDTFAGPGGEHLAARSAWSGSGGPLQPAGFVFFLVGLPFLPVVLACRWLRILPWTLEATTRPWGRRGPPMTLRYQVRGRLDCTVAMQELATKLARGDGGPELVHATRI
jgi:hypothetical protein